MFTAGVGEVGGGRVLHTEGLLGLQLGWEEEEWCFGSESLVCPTRSRENQGGRPFLSFCTQPRQGRE